MNEKLKAIICEAVEKAYEELIKDGIDGYGLEGVYIEGTEFGKLIRTSGYLNEGSVSGGGYMYKWLPPEGFNIFMIGSDDDVTYYAVDNDKEYHIIKFVDGEHYHDKLLCGNVDEIPEYVFYHYLIRRLKEKGLTVEEAAKELKVEVSVLARSW